MGDGGCGGCCRGEWMLKLSFMERSLMMGLRFLSSSTKSLLLRCCDFVSSSSIIAKDTVPRDLNDLDCANPPDPEAVEELDTADRRCDCKCAAMTGSEGEGDGVELACVLFATKVSLLTL